MSEASSTVSVTILGKEYQVACPADQVDALTKAARFLDDQMEQIRASGKVVGLDRVAVMAALNMANDLIGARHTEEAIESDAKGKIIEMRERVESALQQGKQLELG